MDGKIGDATLTAPAAIRFELDDRRVLFADQSGGLPNELSRYGYDLCFPLSAVPLGRVRRDLPEWREDRRYRRLAVLPFLFPELCDVWPKRSEELLQLFAPVIRITSPSSGTSALARWRDIKAFGTGHASDAVRLCRAGAKALPPSLAKAAGAACLLYRLAAHGHI